jgi:hypothetical protein
MSVRTADRITDNRMLTMIRTTTSMASGIAKARNATGIERIARATIKGTPSTRRTRNNIGPIKPRKRRATSRST